MKMARMADELRNITGEAFTLMTAFNPTKEKYMVTLISGQNPNMPFPIEKFHMMNDILVGGFMKKRTKQDFTKLEHQEYIDNGILTVRLNVGPCLNPNERDKMIWTRGSKAKVQNPEECNGMEGILARGLHLVDNE